MDEMELQQRTQALEHRERALAERIVRVELTEALRVAGCRPEALIDTAALMATSAQVELSEAGDSIAKISIGGGEAMGTAASARAFLAKRPFLQAPTDAKPPSAPAPVRPDSLVHAGFGIAPPAAKPATRTTHAIDADVSPSDLVQRGWAEQPE